MVVCVVGTRPNFMKMAPVLRGLEKLNVPHILVHTGQHYDRNMSKVFFDDLKIKKPEVFLGVGSGSHAEITGKILIKFEKTCMKTNPSLVVVAGDVNSTLACSITAKKLNIPVAHVESGLRSFDKNMPEEINRIMIDHISDLLFVSEKSGIKNLKKEGIKKEKIFFVGNSMIDSVQSFLSKSLGKKPWLKYDLEKFNFILVTFHRPSNVDNELSLKAITIMLNKISKSTKIIFPIHPRTLNNLKFFKLCLNNRVTLVDPLSYIDFLGLMAVSKAVITDSGGVQEETTFLNIPCITYRKNTERPITIESGTNFLVGNDTNLAFDTFMKIVEGKIKKKKNRLPKWDGLSGKRISEKIKEYILTSE